MDLELTEVVNMSMLTEKGSCDIPICGSSNAHAQVPIRATDMLFCLNLSQGPYYMSANSKGSGETAPMHRLVSAFAGRLCDEYLFLMCWRILVVS